MYVCMYVCVNFAAGAQEINFAAGGVFWEKLTRFLNEMPSIL